MQPILIVGAGPTGLTAAIELRRFGLPVRLIDKAAHPAQWSQALVVQARTLEQFDRYGIAAEAIRRGRIVAAAHFHNEAKSLARLDLRDHIPGRFPYLLCLPQNDTEDILTHHAKSLGVTIERNVELTGFSNTAAGDAVEAHLRHAGGQDEHMTASFLLGCDGAHSTVRKLTGTPFTGDTVKQRFSLGDLQLTGPDVPGPDLSLYFHHGGWALFLLLLRSGDYRVITIFPVEADGPTPPPPTLEDFNADFARFGLKITATGSSWLSPFRVNERKAGQYRHGNVFLLGDAAHIHSPAGGQGMNTGIQDAANLAWKLAAVLHGAPRALLDSYDEERGAVARAVLRGSALALRLAGSGNRLIEHLRNVALPYALGLGFVEDLAARSISQTGISYRGSAAVADHAHGGPLRAGDRMPDATDAAGNTLLAPLAEARHLLVAVDVDPDTLTSTPGTVAVSTVRSADPGWSPAPQPLLGSGPLQYLIRPDGYIGYRGAPQDSDHLALYLRSVGLR